MKRPLSLLIIGVALVLYSASLVAPVALAATSGGSGSGQALEISPPVMTLTANPGQVLKTKISLRDVTDGDLSVSNEIDDFVAAGEDGTPKILLGQDANDSPFSMKDWVQPLPQLLLKSKQIKTLDVVINVPKSASPGGHYGVIRFTGTPPGLTGSGVSLSASLGALMLITVNGDIKENLTVQQFSVGMLNSDKTVGKAANFFEAAPLAFTELIKNEGNIHEKPTGQVIIKDMFGKPVAGLNINLPPRNILPDSTRKFTQNLDKSVIGTKRLFGHYTATLTVKYGKDQMLTAKQSFWVIPWKLILFIVILLIGGFFGLRYLIRRYNRFIISKVQGGPAAKSKRSKQPRRK
jgi:hypothetical protein